MISTKKFLALLLTLSLGLLITGFAGADSCEIALITDSSGISAPMMASLWEGIQEYAEKNDKTCGYYTPGKDSALSYVKSIIEATEKGARVLVLPGFSFGQAFPDFQNLFPDAVFILMDSDPFNDSIVSNNAPNTFSVYYREEQAGYLAGYAAVKDGYTRLGFLGGMAIQSITQYGYGFLQGIDAAAAESKIQTQVKFWYSNVFWPTADVRNQMSKWFAEGTGIVFSVGGGIYTSALEAADEADRQLIGVDIDQGYLSGRILTSAMKNYKGSVLYVLGRIYDNGGTLSGDMRGAVVTLGVGEDGVCLPTAPGSWRFKSFTPDEYKVLLESIRDGSKNVNPAVDVLPILANTTVDYQN